VLKGQDGLLKTNIDSSILEVLEDNIDQLKSLAQSRNMSSAQLLESRLPYLLLPDFIILMKIASVIAEEAQSDNETERAVALSFIKRASAQLTNKL